MVALLRRLDECERSASYETAKQLTADDSTRKLTTPISVAGVAVGSYGSVVVLLLTLYYLLNLGIPARRDIEPTQRLRWEWLHR
jgi:hypothetical protein